MNTHTLTIQFNKSLLILRQLGSAGNLINLSLKDGDLTVSPSLQESITILIYTSQISLVPASVFISSPWADESSAASLCLQSAADQSTDSSPTDTHRHRGLAWENQINTDCAIVTVKPFYRRLHLQTPS